MTKEDIIRECKQFFGIYADYVLDIRDSNITLKIKSTDLRNEINMSSCYIFFEKSERVTIYKEWSPDDNQAQPRTITGYRDVTYPNRFSISRYDNSGRSTFGYGPSTTSAVNEEISGNNTVSAILNRHINIKAIETRIQPEITRQRTLNDVTQSIQSSIIESEVDDFLTNIVQKTNNTLTEKTCTISGVLGNNDLQSLFKRHINSAIENRLTILFPRFRSQGLLKAQFEMPIKTKNSINLQQIDETLSRILKSP